MSFSHKGRDSEVMSLSTRQRLKENVYLCASNLPPNSLQTAQKAPYESKTLFTCDLIAVLKTLSLLEKYLSRTSRAFVTISSYLKCVKP